MSYDPASTSVPSRPAGVPLALALLALAIAVFLAAQIGNAAQQKKLINWQITTGEKQIETAKTNETQLAEAIKQQETVVKQAAEVQAQYQKLLDDLLKLADEDDDAKQIVEKWKISRAAQGGAAAGAAPAAGTAAPAATPAPPKP